MGTFWKKGSDTLIDGTVVGGLLGFAICYGDKIYSWIVDFIPTTWNWFGDTTIPIIIIGAGLLIGYATDRM
mgnify:CR=1 FL=1